MTQSRYLTALAAGIYDAMAEDESVFVLGEDVRQNIRGTTRGVEEAFGPARILDTPLSEQAFTGFATGAAMTGFRPVVEYQIPSLLYLVFEQIVNQANKIRLMTGGQASVPVTYVVPGSGARMGLAGQHSDHPYAMLAQAGVKTVVPSMPQQAYDCVRTAICDDDPVVVFSPAAVQGVRGELVRVKPEPCYAARVCTTGTDLTIVAVGHLVHEAIRVATEPGLPYSIEVLDAAWIYPLDRETILASLRRTGRLLVLDDSNRSCGFAGEVIASAAESGLLRAAPRRLGRPDMTAMPFSVTLETAILPGRTEIAAAVREMMENR